MMIIVGGPGRNSSLLVAGTAMIAAMTVSSPASAVQWSNFIASGVNTLSDACGRALVTYRS
jgi:hypothetical protein